MDQHSNPNCDEWHGNPYLSVREAADFLGLTRQTIYTMVRARELPAARIGGTIRLSRAALDAYITAQHLACLKASA